MTMKWCWLSIGALIWGCRCWPVAGTRTRQHGFHVSSSVFVALYICSIWSVLFFLCCLCFVQFFTLNDFISMIMHPRYRLTQRWLWYDVIKGFLILFTNSISLFVVNQFSRIHAKRFLYCVTAECSYFYLAPCIRCIAYASPYQSLLCCILYIF